ncbi:MAG: SIS domain-containing protein [Roseibium sp.]
MPQNSQMRCEILEIPDAVERLLTEGSAAIRAAAAALEKKNPVFLASIARGSSDHAATYFKYCSELVTGLPVASLGPSVASVYGSGLRLAGCACLAISQSGASPDIVRMTGMSVGAGALALALTNHPDSDLARVSDHALALHAGTEESVAATKTFVSSAVAALWLLAEWQRDADLLAAIRTLPTVFEKAIREDWGAAGAALGERDTAYCLGRGPGLAMSGEAALKLKETCLIHAESYSSAEVLHGPVSIVGTDFPVIVLAAGDAAEQGLIEVAETLQDKDARVFVTSPRAAAGNALPVVRTAHPLTDPLSLIVSFYAMVETVAGARGIDPDRPRHLKKVTRTV